MTSYPDTARTGAARLCLSVALLSGAVAGLGPPAAAQVAGSTAQGVAPSADVIRQREQELETTIAQQKSAAELQQKLKAEIAAIGEDRSKLNAQLIDAATEVRTIEAKIDDAEARLVRSIRASGKSKVRSIPVAPK
jgi:septal ring factor EnvC (AmiA/AmiB activator)